MSTCSLCHSDRSIKATLLPPYYSQTTGQERMCAVPKKLPNAMNVTSKVSPSLRPLFEFYIYWDLSKLIHWFFFKLFDRFVKIDNRISLKVVTWICQSCYLDFLLFYVFLVLCQSKPRWNLTKISKLVEASALNWSYWMSLSNQCLGSAVPFAMFFSCLFIFLCLC